MVGTIPVDMQVVLVGLIGAIPFLLISRRYGNVAPIAVYTLLVAGTATALGNPHTYRATVGGHVLIAGIGLAFLGFVYAGHKQVEHVAARVRNEGMARVE